MTLLVYFKCDFCDFVTENTNVIFGNFCRGYHLASYCNIEETKELYETHKKHIFYISSDYLSSYNGSEFKVRNKLKKIFMEKINFKKKICLADTNLHICDCCIAKWLREQKIETFIYFYHFQVDRPLF